MRRFLSWVAASGLCAVFLAGSCMTSSGGITGEYFNNADFTSLVFTRVDATVDFNWGVGAPSASVGADTFSVKWQGQLEPEFSEEYSFYVTADDGFRLWVNDRLIMARTAYSSAALEMKGRLRLDAGKRYNLVLQYTENTGQARVKLEWSSASQPRQVIPWNRLFSNRELPDRGMALAETWMGVAGGGMGALTNRPGYPQKPDAREPLLALESLTTNWADQYGTRVTGWVVPERTGEHTFGVAGDEAVHLWLGTNDQAISRVLVASNTVATGYRNFQAQPGQISAGVWLQAHTRYYFELIHLENSGDDHFSVAWKQPGESSLAILSGEHLVPSGTERTQPAASAYHNTLSPAHPRLYVTPQRLEWMRRLLAARTEPQLNGWWASLSNSATTLLSAPLSTYNPDERGTILGTSRGVVDRIYKLSFAYQMTGVTNFAERAWQELEQVASTNFPNWHPAHFLDTAEMTHACAIGYDWLHAYWSPSRRDIIRNAIITKGINPSLTLYTNNSGWVRASANNWNLVCNGGMVLGALAIGSENEALSEYVLSKAVASAAQVMRRYSIDNGAWYEGPGYWDYTTDYNFRLMAGLESALGSDFGMSDVEAVWETGLEPIYMVGPTRLSYNFADAGAGNMRGPQLFWLARRYNRPEYSAWQRANGSGEVLDLLWYDWRGTDAKTQGLPPDNYFRGATQISGYYPSESLTLRTRWQDGDATFIGFKGGEMGADHGNLDAGSFVLDALGNRWAHDLGGDSYALPGYFSEPQRWTYYRMRAEGHNTLVINPGAAADQVVNSVPPVVLYTSEPQQERSAAVVDLTSAYTGMSRVWRGVQLFNQRRWFLVQDEIQCPNAATVWWFMHYHTNTAAQMASDGLSVLFSRGADRLWVGLISSNGTFALTNAAPLPSSPNPAGQNANTSYRKLALRFTGVTNTTVAVLMTPLRPGEPIPTVGQTPELLPLVNWGAASTNTVAEITNTPPTTARWGQTVPLGSVANVNLRKLVQDAETPVTNLHFRVGGAVNGAVFLMPDGFTAQFHPLATNQCSFKYWVIDQWPDRRMLFHYDFEGVDTAVQGYVEDRSQSGLYGEVSKAGSGSAAFSSDTPTMLQPVSRGSFLVRESGDFNGARLVARVAPADLDFNRESWTYSGWFKRLSATNDDFVFYLGNSDGFGSPDEFHLHGTASQSLSLRHFYGSSLSDLDITIPNVRTGQWNHAAVVYNATNANHGTVTLYLNGTQMGFDNSVTLNMPQGDAPVLGGHGSTGFAVTRWYNGLLDDCVFFRGALAREEVGRLAQAPAAFLGGAASTNTVYLHYGPLPPPEMVESRIGTNEAAFRVRVPAGFECVLERTLQLATPQWLRIATNLNMTGGTAEVWVTDPAPPAAQSFYRTVLVH